MPVSPALPVLQISANHVCVQLIIISGYPCSGKSTRAQQIAAYFDARIAAAAPGSREARLRVHIVNAESLSLPRTAYRDARAEKEARATEYSAIKRLLSKDDVVIADGLNYIKGLRYQLFCEAKALLTPSCVVCIPPRLPPTRADGSRSTSPRRQTRAGSGTRCARRTCPRMRPRRRTRRTSSRT